MDVGQHVWILAATYPNPLNYPTTLQFGVMYDGQRAVLGWTVYRIRLDYLRRSKQNIRGSSLT